MAINPIDILKDTIASVAHTVTISSVDTLGGGLYKLNTTNTYYLRTAGKPKTITIDAVDYIITDFDINVYITVQAADGSDTAVTASTFTIDPPLFVWGNPQMVSEELVKRVKNGTVVWPYMWIVEIGSTDGTLAPEAAVTETRNFNIFFLDSADKVNWTIEQHYDNDIYTLNNYIEFFFTILRSRRDLFETDSITYSKDNYINFGDYIVDEGMKELILNGGITGIQLQMSIPFIINTCSSVTFLEPCPDVTSDFNGTATDVDTEAGQNIAFNVVDDGGNDVGTLIVNTANEKKVEVTASGDPVDTQFNGVPTGVDTPAGDNLSIGVFSSVPALIGTLSVNTANNKGVTVADVEVQFQAVDTTVGTPAEGAAMNFRVVDASDDSDIGSLVTNTLIEKKVEVTLPAAALNTADLYKTGVTSSGLTNDDGALQRGRGSDWYNLDFTNPYGHAKRISGVTGGYYDESLTTYHDVNGVATTQALAFPNGLMVNWATYNQVGGTVLVMDWNYLSGSLSTACTNSPYTVGGFTGLMVVNFSEWLSFGNMGVALAFWNYPPLSYIANSTARRVITSSRVGASANYLGYISSVQFNQLGSGSTYTQFVGRYFTLTELGL